MTRKCGVMIWGVMSSKPDLVELGMRSTSVLSCTWTKYIILRTKISSIMQKLVLSLWTRFCLILLIFIRKIIYLVQLQLKTEVLRTPSSTRSGFELMTPQIMTPHFRVTETSYWLKRSKSAITVICLRNIPQQIFAPLLEVSEGSEVTQPANNYSLTSLQDFYEQVAFLLFSDLPPTWQRIHKPQKHQYCHRKVACSTAQKSQ